MGLGERDKPTTSFSNKKASFLQVEWVRPFFLASRSMLLMVHLVLTVHDSANTNDFRFPTVVDVDIGVQGEAIKTSNFLVTFDPFDSLDARGIGYVYHMPSARLVGAPTSSSIRASRAAARSTGRTRSTKPIVRHSAT